jgi:hypothetical protein
MTNYDDDYDDYLDPDEKAEKARQYQDRYVNDMQARTQNMDEDARKALFKEMETIQYNPSRHPEQDCELNLLRAQKIVSSKKRKLGGAIGSFLRFKQREDGGSVASIDRWADKVMREED